MSLTNEAKFYKSSKGSAVEATEYSRILVKNGQPLEFYLLQHDSPVVDIINRAGGLIVQNSSLDTITLAPSDYSFDLTTPVYSFRLIEKSFKYGHLLPLEHFLLRPNVAEVVSSHNQEDIDANSTKKKVQQPTGKPYEKLTSNISQQTHQSSSSQIRSDTLSLEVASKLAKNVTNVKEEQSRAASVISNTKTIKRPHIKKSTHFTLNTKTKLTMSSIHQKNNDTKTPITAVGSTISPNDVQDKIAGRKSQPLTDTSDISSSSSSTTDLPLFYQQHPSLDSSALASDARHSKESFISASQNAIKASKHPIKKEPSTFRLELFESDDDQGLPFPSITKCSFKPSNDAPLTQNQFLYSQLKTVPSKATKSSSQPVLKSKIDANQDNNHLKKNRQVDCHDGSHHIDSLPIINKRTKDLSKTNQHSNSSESVKPKEHDHLASSQQITQNDINSNSRRNKRSRQNPKVPTASQIEEDEIRVTNDERHYGMEPVQWEMEERMEDAEELIEEIEEEDQVQLSQKSRMTTPSIDDHNRSFTTGHYLSKRSAVDTICDQEELSDEELHSLLDIVSKPSDSSFLTHSLDREQSPHVHNVEKSRPRQVTLPSRKGPFLEMWPVDQCSYSPSHDNESKDASSMHDHLIDMGIKKQYEPRPSCLSNVHRVHYLPLKKSLFTAEEDFAILVWMIRVFPLQNRRRSSKVWKWAEQHGLTRRSWDSMRNRVRVLSNYLDDGLPLTLELAKLVRESPLFVVNDKDAIISINWNEVNHQNSLGEQEEDSLDYSQFLKAEIERNRKRLQRKLSMSTMPTESIESNILDSSILSLLSS